MKSRATSRKIIIFMLLTAFLFCGVQGVGYSGELFWGLGEIFGAVGEGLGAGLGAAGGGIGAGFGAVGEGLGAAGEGLGAAWEAFDAVGEAFGVHPVELIATGGISVILRYIPLPDANVRGRVRGASNVFVIPDGGAIGIVVSGSVHFWDPHTEQFAAPLIHGAPIFNFVVSPDSGLLATTSEGGNVQLWSRNAASVDSPWVPSGQQLDMTIAGYTTWAQLKLEPKIQILSTAFSPDGEILAGGSARGTVRLWNATTGGIRTTLRGHTDSVTSIAFSPDGGLLATASADGTVRLWNPGTGDLHATLSGHTGSVLSVAFSRANGLLASASTDGTVRLWNPNTGGHEATLDHESPVLDIAFSPDGDVLASANVNGSVRLWDPNTRTVQALLGHGSPVTTVAFGSDKNTLITGSRDGLIRQWEVWDVTDSAPEILTASTALPLTESTIHGSVVTLTLSRLAYAPARGIRDPVTVSGIAGVTVDTSNIRRVNDTELTVELEFNGDIDTDANITFTVEANAVAGYFGPALTAQIPVTAVTETVVASTASPLTEATLDGSVVILTLRGRTYARSSFDIREALSVSGVRAVTVERFDVDRVSDTEVAVELEFKGDIDEDATLTFTVGADAIAGYGGTALTAQLSVAAYTESVAASTPSPLTEATLESSAVTLTLSGCAYAQSILDIRRALKVSGVAGATVDKSNTKRVSDTEATVGIKFNGDMNADGSLTLTVGAGAIEGYKGTALTTQLPVTASTESLTASTPVPLTEAILNGSVVTLTLVGRSYAQSIGDGVNVSGIAGVTIPWRGLDRKSDTEITVELEFNGDIDTDSTLIFSVGADAITGYGGPALTAQLPVTAYTESVTVSTASPLTEPTLDGSIVTLTLNGRVYAESIWDVRRAVKVSGTAGVTVSTSRVSDTEVTVKLEFNGDIDADTTLTFSVGADGIAGYNGPALTAQLPVTASIESVAASTTSPLAEATLEGSVVTLTLSGRNYVSSSWDISRALTITGIDGVTKDSVRRISDTEATVELEFNGDFDADATLTFTVGADAIAGYGGPALSAQVAVSGGEESVIASTASSLTEATLNESVVTLTLNGRVYAQSVWDIRGAVKVSGIAGVTVSIRRVSDTEVTVELEFNGDIDADANLTFSVGKDAIANYNGPALAVQLPVTASTEAVVASTSFPLTEPRLNGSVVTLTLAGRVYAPVWDIRDAVKVSGIAGVTIPRHQTDRRSDNEVTVKLEFNGNVDADATLTFSVGADAIKGYSGLALTAQLPVTASMESVTASTTSPLTEATLEGSVVTLTLSGCTFERSIFDIRDAVTVAGIDGVTMPWHQPDRKSDTKITIELEFDGDMDADGTLTFTVGADAIANYNGPALTAQLPVTASKDNALAANFPNPFNPETWIPYQLASDADVTLTIHALNGQPIRHLTLGHQVAGTYYSRSRAAYWDGKNDFGEPVASGVYFYTLTARDFTATRKMLIRK